MVYSKLLFITLILVLISGCSDPRITVSPTAKAALHQHILNHLTPNYF
jgi:uncharacterized lipoprotein YajG